MSSWSLVHGRESEADACDNTSAGAAYPEGTGNPEFESTTGA
jgi:hypothetical protein